MGTVTDGQLRSEVDRCIQRDEERFRGVEAAFERYAEVMHTVFDSLKLQLINSDNKIRMLGKHAYGIVPELFEGDPSTLHSLNNIFTQIYLQPPNEGGIVHVLECPISTGDHSTIEDRNLVLESDSHRFTAITGYRRFGPEYKINNTKKDISGDATSLEEKGGDKKFHYNTRRKIGALYNEPEDRLLEVVRTYEGWTRDLHLLETRLKQEVGVRLGERVLPLEDFLTSITQEDFNNVLLQHLRALS